VVEIAGTIVIGFLAGLVAKFIMPGRDPGGIVVTALLGIGGALLARWAGQLVGIYTADDAAGFVAAVLGAIVILILYRMVRRGR
jgi:uncharacterized membrane protein YeaQ/YmgE (transglycosylase-associated protein family)